MQITRLERIVCCVPFLPGILPSPGYPAPLVQDGYAIVPTVPSLGVELDEDAIWAQQ